MCKTRTIFSFALGFVVAGVLTGCTTETYRRWADADVKKLVDDRKEEVLGYHPSTPINAPVPKTATPRRAYATIPFTPIPSTQPAPVEPDRVVVPFAKLGPELKWMKDRPSPTTQADYGLSVPEQRARERLTLGPASPFNARTRLDLFSALRYGIQHSRQYQDQLENLYLAGLDVTLRRHLLLEPHPFVNTTFGYYGRQGNGSVLGDSAGQSINSRSAFASTVNAGVTQPLPYGGNITADAVVGFVNALNKESQDGEAASVAMSATVPLLRGAGMVNLEPLVASERTLVYQVRSFELYRRSFVVSVASQYFNLNVRLQSVNDRRINFNNTKMILEQTEALFAADRLSYLEVQRARQSLLSAQTLLITAQTSFDAATDNFKQLVGMPVDERLDVVPVALEVVNPSVEADKAIAIAERYRLDLQTARDQIDDARRQVSNAENGLLPDVSLVANTNVGNLPGSAAKSLDARTFSYSAGLQIGLPIDRVSERNTYRNTLINLQQAQRALVDQTESVKAAVRNSLRQIHTAEYNLQIQKRGMELAQGRLEYSTELLRLGKVSSSRDLVEAQSSLLTAQDAFEQARSDLQTNILQFLQTTGTLRVDPTAGTIGQVLNDAEPDMNPRPILPMTEDSNIPPPQG